MENTLSGKLSSVRSKQMLATISLFVGVVMVIFIIIAVILSGKDYSDDVSKLVAQQTELVRVIDLGNRHDSVSQISKNYATTVQLTTNSAVNLLSPLDGGNPSKNILAKYTSADVEDTLDDAASSNSFNDTFISMLVSQIEDIRDQLTLVESKVESEHRDTIDTLLLDFQALLDNAPQ
jgi:hypothetical protein